jgi:putative acetyltransferase
MDIKSDDLSGPEMAGFLKAHLQHMIRITPPGSVHALDIEALKKPEISFWGVREGSQLVGCGALKELDSKHAEIKSMRTAASHLQKGVASHLLEYILGEARRRKYGRISLETGSFDAFRPARNLYKKFGFTYCEPFADYIPDSNSVFMTLKLRNKDAAGGVGQ